jgi:hypothetical protein
MYKLIVMNMKKTNSIRKKDKSSKKREITNANETSTRRSKPSEDEIRERANDIYLQRLERGEHGTPEGDWHEAELDLMDSEF